MRKNNPDFSYEYIEGPKHRNQTSEWLRSIAAWRELEKKKTNYSSYVYDHYLEWSSTSYMQPQLMVHDRFFFDSERYHYTVKTYLEDVNERYGGIDNVLLWPAYPNLGIDSRNQFDMLGDLPGGIETLQKVVEEFRQFGVRVFLPYNPWDTGTRKSSESDMIIVPKLLALLNADGFNCDTCGFPGVPSGQRMFFEFWNNSLALDHPVVIEPELGGGSKALEVNKMSWGYWGFQYVPPIDRYKWIERKHLTHICQRWTKDKTVLIQDSFFNMIGFESWENVWGIFMKLTERNGEALRRVRSLLHFFSDFGTSERWEPHTNSTIQSCIFASKWEGSGQKKSQRFWTMINRCYTELDGEQLKIDGRKVEIGYEYYDVYHGVLLHPGGLGNETILSFNFDMQGFGAILEIPKNEVDEELIQFMAKMRKMTKTKLSNYSNDFSFLPQEMLVYNRTQKPIEAPKDMRLIPAIDKYDFVVKGIEIEGAEYLGGEGVDVQYPWEDFARQIHNKTISISSFFIDTTPVTNSAFHEFILDSKYRPRDSHNYLRDWINQTTFPTGWEDKPVTWVSLSDAISYCNFHSKRLPNEWEWQYAAQGSDGRLYPWGNEFDSAKVPVKDQSRDPRPPDSVFSHPQGSSFFGVWDLVGNVWQWTNEFGDEHTRSAILRGGSLYYPQTKSTENGYEWKPVNWYFPNTYKLNEHGKLLLMADSIDRSGFIGFRCVQDV